MHQMKDGGRQMQDALCQEKKWIRSMKIKTMKNERPEKLEIP